MLLHVSLIAIASFRCTSCSMRTKLLQSLHQAAVQNLSVRRLSVQAEGGDGESVDGEFSDEDAEVLMRRSEGLPVRAEPEQILPQIAVQPVQRYDGDYLLSAPMFRLAKDF